MLSRSVMPDSSRPINCSLPGSSVHGILQTRTLEWVAMPSSRSSSQPRGQTHVSYVSCIGRQVLYLWRQLESPPHLKSRLWYSGRYQGEGAMDRLAPPLPFNLGPHLLGVRTLTRLASWPWMLCFPGLCTGCPVVPLWPIPAPRPSSVVKRQVRLQAPPWLSSLVLGGERGQYCPMLPGWTQQRAGPSCGPAVASLGHWFGESQMEVLQHQYSKVDIIDTCIHTHTYTHSHTWLNWSCSNWRTQGLLGEAGCPVEDLDQLSPTFPLGSDIFCSSSSRLQFAHL